MTTILIVEDDADFAGLLTDLLASVADRLPATVETAADANSARARLQEARFDLVLLDHQLPGGSGLDVLEVVHALPAEQRPAVIMLTAAGSEEIAVEAMKKGAKDYIPKLELRLPVLHRAIVGALERHRLERRVEEQAAQLNADLRMARDVQRALLPQRYPTFPPTAPPSASRLQFAHRYRPAIELGGDFFDVIAINDHAAGVLICDVMGHGLRAALVTAILRGLVEELMPLAAAPGEYLTAINHGLREILKATRPPLFVSAFYLVADLERSQFRYANAGHPPPVHVQRRAGVVDWFALDATARPLALGVLDQQVYPTHECPLTPGDGVLLYTDGLFEVRGADGELYGESRLLDTVTVELGLQGATLCDHLWEAVRSFAPTGEFPDDVCLVAVEVAPG